MPPKTRITKELIIEKSFEITKSEGIENLNARYLAKQLNCSTMPIFKVFNDMNELKFELKKKIDAYYNDFILAHLDKNNYLYTMSFAYIDFAIKEKNLFGALFVNEFIKTRSIEEVVHSAWNRETIEYSAQQFGITIKESEILYRDIRFYTHGIATQIYGGNMALKEEGIQTLLKNAINKFLK